MVITASGVMESGRNFLLHQAVRNFIFIFLFFSCVKFHIVYFLEFSDTKLHVSLLLQCNSLKFTENRSNCSLQI